MSLIKISTKGSALLCSELDNNFDYVLDLANATGKLECTKLNNLDTCLATSPFVLGLQADITSTQTAIGVVAQDLTDSTTLLQGNINTLTTLVGNQATTIADLNAQLATFITQFNALNNSITSVNSRLLTLEGRTLSLEQALATGLIFIWSGLITAIPTGYFLCNGTNGTPDLRDRFIMGAGGTYATNTNGGTVGGHTHTINTVTASTVLDWGQMPFHGHNVTVSGHSHDLLVWWEGYGGAPGSDGVGDALNRNNAAIAGEDNARGGEYHPTNGNGTRLVSEAPGLSGVTSGAGNNAGHVHNLSATTSVSSSSNLPPYYALAYIMKF